MDNLSMLNDEQKERLSSLVKERDGIIERVEKLNKFIYYGHDRTLSDDARYALHDQKRIMDEYIAILNRRIELFLRDNAR